MNDELEEFNRAKALQIKKEGRTVTHITILYSDGSTNEFDTEDYRVRDYVLRYRVLDTERFIHIPLTNVQQFVTEVRRIFE